MALCNNCGYKDTNTQIIFNLDTGDLLFQQNGIIFEIYEDKDGNVEIYIPENEYHTGFYINQLKNVQKCPKED